MFSRRVFGGSPDSFRLQIEYGSPSEAQDLVRLPVAVAGLQFEFNSDEGEDPVVQRFLGRKSDVLASRIEERVTVKLAMGSSGQKTIWANSMHAESQPRLLVQLSVVVQAPVLRQLQVSRVSSTGIASDAVLEALLGRCDLTTVWKLKGGTCKRAEQPSLGQHTALDGVQPYMHAWCLSGGHSSFTYR